MNITLLNYGLPAPDEKGRGLRWWHKSGSRWPATILNRGNDGLAYFPWPFLLCYATSMLRAAGHEVTLLDGCLLKWSLDEVEQQVMQTRPDYIVFETSEQTELSDPVVLERIRRIAPVVLIGPNITDGRSDLLNWPGCHAIIPGEYLQSVVDYFHNPLPGIAPAHEVTGQERMDKLPFAQRDPQNFPRYSARFKTTPPGIQGQFVSMWGCQYRCKFCIWIHSYWPKTTQLQKQFSVPRLEAELDHMLAQFPGITSLYDDSDNHFYREKDAYAFAEMMARKHLPWAVLTRADTYMKKNDIDRDLWKAYRDNGCYAVKIGVEGAQEVMDLTNKRMSEEVVREFVPLMNDLGIEVYCSFMIGVPNASPEADPKTLKLIEDLASYCPELFEYFISYCDVTQTTPFANELPTGILLHDGQAVCERKVDEYNLPRTFGGLAPNNLE